MPRPTGLRERKKLEQRQHLADSAAVLFSERGYDAVSIGDVAEAAGVSYQTVYNYFPAKQDLVLDRADELRQRYMLLVRERVEGTSPAAALRPMVEADVARYRDADLREARGQHPALCVSSVLFRGFALLAREDDVLSIARAIADTCPALHPLVVHAHAAALVSVLQATTDRIGRSVLADSPREQSADTILSDALDALASLDHQFAGLVRAQA